MKNFDKTIFFIATVVIGILVLLSYFDNLTTDEGVINTNKYQLTFSKLFYVLRFPTHTLFEKTFLSNTTLFIIGLLLNCFFYGFVIERAIYLYSLSRSSKPQTLQYIEQGRDGYIIYNDNHSSIKLYYEFGGADCVVIITVPSTKEWELKTKMSLADRHAVLNLIAEQVIKDKSPKSYYKISENYIEILSKK